MSCRTDPTQTYTLFLPDGYTTERTWPLLLILDPRGRSVMAAELFLEGAREYGWILVSSNDTRSDGPMEPNLVALNALWPEVNTRFAVDQRRIYAAGFSGGAHLSWLLGGRTGGIAGVIACGGRLIVHYLEGTSFSLYGAAGTTDFNLLPTHRVEEFVARQGNPYRFEVFEGRHQWMPASMALDAIHWMELDAMRRGLRAKDEALIRRLFDQDLAVAEGLLESGAHLAALRRFRAIVRTFEDLHPATDAVASRASDLEETREVHRQLKEEQRWTRYEETYLRQLGTVEAQILQADLVPALPRVLRDLKTASLLRHARAEGIEGVTGQRLINSVVTKTAFYMARDLRKEQRLDRLVLVLQIAAELSPSNPNIQYNLACARSQAGQHEQALEALERALDLGFANHELLATDTDLDSIRAHPRFIELLTSSAPAQEEDQSSPK